MDCTSIVIYAAVLDFRWGKGKLLCMPSFDLSPLIRGSVQMTTHEGVCLIARRRAPFFGLGGRPTVMRSSGQVLFICSRVSPVAVRPSLLRAFPPKPKEGVFACPVTGDLFPTPQTHATIANLKFGTAHQSRGLAQLTDFSVESPTQVLTSHFCDSFPFTNHRYSNCFSSSP